MLQTGILVTCILLVTVGLCPLSFALPPGAVGDCTASQVTAFTESLPNSEECIDAGLEVISPGGQSVKNLTDALPVFCTAECGGSITNFLTHKCNDHSFAYALALNCLETSGSYGEYCRHSFVDLILPTNFSNVESCLDYNSTSSTCPDGCSAALQDVVDQLGCCYQVLYNFSNEIGSHYISDNLVSVTYDLIPFFTNITDPSLWSDCGVDLVELCAGTPFPDTTVDYIGRCSTVQFHDFLDNQLSEECAEAYSTLGMSAFIDVDSLNTICTTTCGLALGQFLEKTCFAPHVALGINASCSGEEDDDETSRCANVFAIENQSNIRAAFYAVRLYCSEFETQDTSAHICPDGCADALTTLASVFGCCYQFTYNNSDVLLLHFINGLFDIETIRFFDIVGDEELWDACNVPLIKECGREPFSAGSLQAVQPISFLAVVLLVLMGQLPVAV